MTSDILTSNVRAHPEKSPPKDQKTTAENAKKPKQGQKHVSKTSKKRIQSQNKIYSVITLRKMPAKGPKNERGKPQEAQTWTKTWPKNVKNTDPITE